MSLFSSFPNVELQVDDFVVTNPMEGAPSDTLLAVGRLSGAIDLRAYLKNKEIILHDLTLSRGKINIYTSESGETNYAIFHPSEEKAEEPSEFDLGKLMSAADLKKIALEDVDIKYISTPDTLSAELADVGLRLSGAMRGESLRGELNLAVSAISLTTSAGPMASEWPLSLDVPFKAEAGVATLDGASLALADLIELAAEGTVAKDGEAIVTDLSLNLSELDLQKTLAALPESLKEMVSATLMCTQQMTQASFSLNSLV